MLRWFTTKESLAKHLKPSIAVSVSVWFQRQAAWCAVSQRHVISHKSVLFLFRDKIIRQLQLFCLKIDVLLFYFSNCMLNNIRVVFLLWNLVKQCKIGLKKPHNSSHNSPILSHNLPWKYRTISEFLLHPNRWPDCMHLLKTSWKSVVLTNKGGRILDILWGFLIKQLFHSHLLDMRW